MTNTTTPETETETETETEPNLLNSMQVRMVKALLAKAAVDYNSAAPPTSLPPLYTVRFFKNRRNLNILTGHLAPPNTNVIHQTTYWGFTREAIEYIKNALGCTAVTTNNNQKETT